MITAPNPLQEFKKIALEVGRDLFQFTKNPIEGMRHLPAWNWPTMLITQASLAALFGILSGVFLGKLSKILNGFIALPISTLFMTAVLSLFFYYVFMFAYKREVPYKKIFIIMVMSSLPWLVVSPLMDIIAPLKIVGLSASGFLLIVGLHEHTQLGKIHISRLVVGAIILYTIFWLIQMLQTSGSNREYRKMATPETLDILEKEFK